MDTPQNLINDLTDRVSALTADLAASERVRQEQSDAIVSATEALRSGNRTMAEATAVINVLSAILVDQYRSEDSHSRESAIQTVQNIIDEARSSAQEG